MKVSFLHQCSGQVCIGSRGEYSLKAWFTPFGSTYESCVVHSDKGIVHLLLLLKLSLLKQQKLMKYAEIKYPYPLIPQTAQKIDNLFKDGAFALLYPISSESIYARIITLRIPAIDTRITPPYVQQGKGHSMFGALQNAIHAPQSPLEIIDASMFI
mgnify:CR=1 FL=1